MKEKFGRLDPLGDRNFQRFLIEQGAMTVAKGFENGAIEGRTWEMKSSKRGAPLREKLWSLLVADPGYIVPSQKIAEELYGSPASADIHAAYLRGLELRRLNPNSDPLFVKYCGQGLGVENLCPSYKDDLDPLYLLWQERNKFVNIRVLADRLVGDMGKEAVATSLVRFNKLPEKANFDNAKIEIADFNTNRFFRLKLLDKTERDAAGDSEKPPFIGIYSIEYQEWLAKIGVIEYSKEFKTLKLKEGKILSKNQKQVVEFLTRYAGYMVPLEKLARIYERELDPESWRVRMSRYLEGLRMKCVNPEDFLFPVNGGWALGIKELHMPVSALKPLYHLWQNQDDFVQLGHHPDFPAFEKKAAVKLRKLLSSGPYILGSVQERPGLQILTLKSNLVT